MLEVLVGLAALITPYLLGCIINVLAHGFSFEHWEGIGWTYIFGIFILAMLFMIVVTSYCAGRYVILLIK